MQFFESIAKSFKSFSWNDALILVILALVFGFILLYIKRNNAKWLVYVLSVFFALWFVFAILGIKANPLTYGLSVSFALTVSAMLFRNEIKRDIFRLTYKSKFNAEALKLSHDEVHETVGQIVKACQNMSKNDVGGLIVVANELIDASIVESGTVINATISTELLETIFFPKSPLHDGAIIISGDKILAAGCYLPLSQSTDVLARELGTRHRAALGLTETNPTVTVIVVSEETGIISAFADNKFARYLDASKLTRALEKSYNLIVNDAESKGEV